MITFYCIIINIIKGPYHKYRTVKIIKWCFGYRLRFFVSHYERALGHNGAHFLLMTSEFVKTFLVRSNWRFSFFLMSTQSVTGWHFGKTSVAGWMLLKLPISRKKLDKKSLYMVSIVNERSVRIQNKGLNLT